MTVSSPISRLPTPLARSSFALARIARPSVVSTMFATIARMRAMLEPELGSASNRNATTSGPRAPKIAWKKQSPPSSCCHSPHKLCQGGTRPWRYLCALSALSAACGTARTARLCIMFCTVCCALLCGLIHTGHSRRLCLVRAQRMPHHVLVETVFWRRISSYVVVGGPSDAQALCLKRQLVHFTTRWYSIMLKVTCTLREKLAQSKQFKLIAPNIPLITYSLTGSGRKTSNLRRRDASDVTSLRVS